MNEYSRWYKPVCCGLRLWSTGLGSAAVSSSADCICCFYNPDEWKFRRTTLITRYIIALHLLLVALLSPLSSAVFLPRKLRVGRSAFLGSLATTSLQPMANSLHRNIGIKKTALGNPLQPLKSVLPSLAQDKCMSDCLVLDSVKFNVFFLFRSTCCTCVIFWFVFRGYKKVSTNVLSIRTWIRTLFD